MGKTGLVVEGGGLRGIYAAGVLDVLMEQDVRVDGIIGTSAGAIHAGNYLTGQIGRGIRYNLKYCRDKRYMSYWSWITTGDLVGVDFCYRELPERLDVFDYDAFAASDVEYYATCSNLETGKAEYIRCLDMRKDMDYLRASASLPLVSRTVEVGGKKLLDGGTCDSIPVAAFRKMGFAKNVVILTRPRGYQKKKDSLLPLMRLKYRKYPQYVRAAAKRHLRYNRTLQKIAEWEKKGEVLVLAPSQSLAVGRMEKDPEKIRKMYELGRSDALARISEIKAFLQTASQG